MQEDTAWITRSGKWYDVTADQENDLKAVPLCSKSREFVECMTWLLYMKCFSCCGGDFGGVKFYASYCHVRINMHTPCGRSMDAQHSLH